MQTLEPVQYAAFALAIVVGSLGEGISNALAATPLSVYTPGLERRAPRLVLEWVLSSVNLILIVVLFLGALGFAASLFEGVALACGFAFFVAGGTLRHFSRSFAFARRQSEVALRCDLLYVASGLVLIGGDWLWMGTVSVVFVLVALFAAQLVATWAAMIALEIRLRAPSRWRSLLRYGRIWKDARWALVGVISTTLQSQAHSLVVSTLIGPAAYAPLAAGQVLFRPVHVVIQAWRMVARPELAVAIRSQGRKGVTRPVLVSMVLLGLSVLLVGGIIFLFWEPIARTLFARHYGDEPMGWIVAISGLITVVVVLRAPGGVLLEAGRQFRALAWATMVGATLSVGSVAALLMVWPPVVCLIGMLVAEIVVLVWLAVRALRYLGAMA